MLNSATREQSTCCVLSSSVKLSCTQPRSSDSREAYCFTMIKTTRSKCLCPFLILIAHGTNLLLFITSTPVTLQQFPEKKLLIYLQDLFQHEALG